VSRVPFDEVMDGAGEELGCSATRSVLAMPLASVLSNADTSTSLALHVGIPIGNADGLDLQTSLAGIERLDAQRPDIAAIQAQHRDCMQGTAE
jgi:hypothetical protein